MWQKLVVIRNVKKPGQFKILWFNYIITEKRKRFSKILGYFKNIHCKTCCNIATCIGRAAVTLPRALVERMPIDQELMGSDLPDP